MKQVVRSALRRSLLQATRQHALLLVITCAFAAAVYALGLFLGVGRLRSDLFFQPSFLMFWGAAVYTAAAVLTFRRWRALDGEGHRIQGLAGWRMAFRNAHLGAFSLERPASLAVVALSLPLLINAFGSWKAALPRIRPFTWDTRLMELDRVLHFGYDPWRLLQPVLGHPPITHGLDFLYYLWLPVNIGMVIWQAWSVERKARLRFFVSYALVWIVLGTVVPTLLPAAGPCYFSAVTGAPDPYAPLMAYLQGVDAQHPLTALFVQGMLWHNYIGGSATPYTGISAMPSIHVAMPVLFALAARRATPRLSLALAGYAILIFLGSVQLGWHYAVDGYVSLIGTVCIWSCSRWAYRRVMNQEELPSTPATRAARLMRSPP